MASADSAPAEPQTGEAKKGESPPADPATTAPAPGPRARQFLELYQKTLSTTLRTITYEHFSACFPTIAANAPENLQGMHKLMMERLEGFAKKDFQDLLRERNVIENLNGLEELVADAQRRKSRAIAGETPPTPPHLLPPSAILQAHLSPQLISQQSQLNAKLQTTQSQNSVLFETIEEQRGEIAALMEGLERAVKDLEQANGILEEGRLRELRGEVKDLEVEMAGV